MPFISDRVQAAGPRADVLLTSMCSLVQLVAARLATQATQPSPDALIQLCSCVQRDVFQWKKPHKSGVYQ